jgi:hypothetical protein
MAFSMERPLAESSSTFTLETVVHRIIELRGQRVLLDADLAVLYGVETRVLVQAVKRNMKRFPDDFMFQLSDAEWMSLRSQTVTSKGKGGRRYAPYAFTEHGALMLSSVLSSPQATEISLLIIRAFVWLRQAVPAYKELAAKLAELESAVSKHDAALGGIIETLHELLTPPDKGKRRIGF